MNLNLANQISYARIQKSNWTYNIQILVSPMNFKVICLAILSTIRNLWLKNKRYVYNRIVFVTTQNPNQRGRDDN